MTARAERTGRTEAPEPGASVLELQPILDRALGRRRWVFGLEGALACLGLAALFLAAAVVGGDTIESVGTWIAAFLGLSLVAALAWRNVSIACSRRRILADLDRRFDSGGALASVLDPPSTAEGTCAAELREALAKRWLREHPREVWSRGLDRPRWVILMIPGLGVACLLLALESAASSEGAEGWTGELASTLRGAIGAGSHRGDRTDLGEELGPRASELLERVEVWAEGEVAGGSSSLGPGGDRPGAEELIELAHDLGTLVGQLPEDTSEDARRGLERARLLAEQRARELGGRPGSGFGSKGAPDGPSVGDAGDRPGPLPGGTEGDSSGNGGGSTLAEGPSAGTMSGSNSEPEGTQGPAVVDGNPPGGNPGADGDPSTAPSEGGGTLAHAWWPEEHDALVRAWQEHRR